MSELAVWRRWVPAAILIACLLALFVVPSVALEFVPALPNAIVGLLLFVPQIVFPTCFVKAGVPGGHVWEGTWLVYWVLVTIGFGWFARGLRPSRAVLAALATVIGATAVLHLVLSWAGFYFVLDTL